MPLDSSRIIYLAAPYSNDAPSEPNRPASPEKRLARFNAVTEVARSLIEDSELVFSPLTMTHPIDLRMKHDPGSEFWVAFDEAFMVHCGRLIVLRLPGWNASSGVEREIRFFESRGIEPEWRNPEHFGIDPKNPEFSAAYS
jgi:hypothetical protein